MNITVLMADGCSSTSVTATLEFFECANVIHSHAHANSESPSFKQPLFTVRTASISGDSVACTGGLDLKPHHSMVQLEDSDLIVVPGFMFNILDALPTLDPIVKWLIDQNEQGRYIASMCTGSFVVAQAGLLDGKSATTHWVFAKQFRERFPRVRLQTERTVTDDGLVLCSGGSTSGSDLLLHLIRKFASPQLASECAKKLLVDASARIQTPYSSTTFKKNHQDANILEAQIYMEKRLSHHFTVEDVAQEFGIGMRNFIRRFKEATDQTPIQYLQNLRIDRAKHLLESSRMSFDQITQQVGYEDGNSFRRLFRKKVGLSPGVYRKRFSAQSD